MEQYHIFVLSLVVSPNSLIYSSNSLTQVGSRSHYQQVMCWLSLPILACLFLSHGPGQGLLTSASKGRVSKALGTCRRIAKRHFFSLLRPWTPCTGLVMVTHPFVPAVLLLDRAGIFVSHCYVKTARTRQFHACPRESGWSGPPASCCSGSGSRVHP